MRLTDKQLDRLYRLLPPTVAWIKTTKAEVDDCQKLEARGLCEELIVGGKVEGRLYRILPDGLRAIAEADESGRLIGLADRVKQPPRTLGYNCEALLKKRGAGRQAEGGDE